LGGRLKMKKKPMGGAEDEHRRRNFSRGFTVVLKHKGAGMLETIGSRQNDPRAGRIGAEEPC